MDRFPEIGLVEISMGRCLSKEGFVTQFYFELCNIHPTVYVLLNGPELDTYKNNLLWVLMGILDFGKGLPSGSESLSSMAQMETGITEDTVMYWEQALLISIAANDEQLNHETANAWRSLIELALEYIIRQRDHELAA